MHCWSGSHIHAWRTKVKSGEMAFNRYIRKILLELGDGVKGRLWPCRWRLPVFNSVLSGFLGHWLSIWGRGSLSESSSVCHSSANRNEKVLYERPAAKASDREGRDTAKISKLDICCEISRASSFRPTPDSEKPNSRTYICLKAIFPPLDQFTISTDLTIFPDLLKRLSSQ
jgi:hypothetical protein